MNTLKDILSTSKGGTDADLNTVFGLLATIIELALRLAGMVAFIFVLYASILYVTSFGDEAKAETAKKTLLWAIIGIGAVAISMFLVNMVDRMLA